MILQPSLDFVNLIHHPCIRWASCTHTYWYSSGDKYSWWARKTHTWWISFIFLSHNIAGLHFWWFSLLQTIIYNYFYCNFWLLYSPPFKKNGIFRNNFLMSLGIIEFIIFWMLIRSYKYISFRFGIQLYSLFIIYMHICKTPKDSQVLQIWFYFQPSFIGGRFI